MIIGYFGLPGAGKTYSAVRYVLKNSSCPWFSRGCKGKLIFSNIPVLGAYKLTFSDMVEYKIPVNSIILLDEVQYWAGSREWASLPVALYNYFSQSRKMGIDLVYTAQDSSRVDKTLREVTNYFYDVQRVVFNLISFDVYTTNADYSLKIHRRKRSFMLIQKKYFKLYDSFYIVAKGKVSNKEKPLWERWSANDFSK